MRNGMWLDNDMNATQQLTEAISHRDAARSAFQTAKTRKASNAAAEELEFWVGKVAMLNVMVERGI